MFRPGARFSPKAPALHSVVCLFFGTEASGPRSPAHRITGEQPHPQGFEALRAEGSALHPGGGAGPQRLQGGSQVKTSSDLHLWNQL